MGYTDEDGGSYRNESLHFSERDLERLDFFTGAFQDLDRRGFASGQETRRQKRDVSGQVRQFGMKFLPERFDELSYRISDVSHEGITLVLRHEEKL
jgi:hypothetical protein